MEVFVEADESHPYCLNLIAVVLCSLPCSLAFVVIA